MDFLVGSFANKGIEVSKKHIEICVRSSYTENFGLRELELIIDESILRGPLAKIEKCDHFIQKGDKSFHVNVSPKGVVGFRCLTWIYLQTK